MQIINVIETFQGIPEVPYSWVIEEEELQAIIVEKAEAFFIEKCIEHDMDPEDIDAALDDGYYEYGDYEIRLNWSIIQH